MCACVRACVRACVCASAYAYAYACPWDMMQVARYRGFTDKLCLQNKTKQMFTKQKFTKQNVYRQVMYTKQNKIKGFQTRYVYKTKYKT